MRDTAFGKSIPLYGIVIVSAVFLALFLGPKGLRAQSPAPLEIHSEALSVTLDATFPRVFKYRTASGKTLPAAIESSRPAIRLNGELFAPGDLKVRVQPTASGATYVMRVPSLDLTLDWRFAVEGNELVFELTKVLEDGAFRLQTLEFPESLSRPGPGREREG